MGSEQEFGDFMPSEPLPEGMAHTRRVLKEPASITATISELYILARMQRSEIRRTLCTSSVDNKAAKMVIRDFWPTVSCLYDITESFIDQAEIAAYEKEAAELDVKIWMASAGIMDGSMISADFMPAMLEVFAFFKKYARLLAGHNIISMQ